MFTNKINAAVISPDKYYIDIKSSGEHYEILKIYSTPNQNKPSTYKIEPIGVKKIGTLNDRAFYKADSVDKQDATNWIEILDSNIVVNPGEIKEVRWKLNIPANYTCETKVTGITVIEIDSTEQNSDQTQVTIGNELVSQIHINAENPSNSECAYYENLLLQEFVPTQAIPIYDYHQIGFKTTIENRSDYLSRNLKGFIEIIGIGEKEVIEFNETNLDIYPKSFRTFQNTWVDREYPKENIISQLIYELTNFKFGIYNVRLGITKNIDNPIIANTTIFILPLKSVIFIVLVILVVLFLIRNNIRTRREIKTLKNRSR